MAGIDKPHGDKLQVVTRIGDSRRRQIDPSTAGDLGQHRPDRRFPVYPNRRRGIDDRAAIDRARIPIRIAIVTPGPPHPSVPPRIPMHADEPRGAPVSVLEAILVIVRTYPAAVKIGPMSVMVVQAHPTRHVAVPGHAVLLGQLDRTSRLAAGHPMQIAVVHAVRTFEVRLAVAVLRLILFCMSVRIEPFVDILDMVSIRPALTLRRVVAVCFRNRPFAEIGTIVAFYIAAVRCVVVALRTFDGMVILGFLVRGTSLRLMLSVDRFMFRAVSGGIGSIATGVP